MRLDHRAGMRYRHRLGMWVLASCALLVSSCQMDNPRYRRNSTVNPPAEVPAPEPRAIEETPPARPPTPMATTPAKTARQLPRIASEPQIGVLLATGPEVVLTLPRGGVISHGGARHHIPPGNLRVRSTGKGLTTSATGKELLGQRLTVVVRPAAGAPTFTAELDVPFGKPQVLQFSGQPEVAIDSGSRKALLIERVGMEQYLRGVLPTEINPSWPMEAIKAQAVAARSYATDRYLVNWDKAWQLHWHYTVDMAYGGIKTLNARMATALEQTRGQLLAAKGLPIPALFHACSGGRTESARNFRPDLTGADELTPMAEVMPSVDDPAGIIGAEALGYSHTHLNWRCELPLATVTAGLSRWAAANPKDRLVVGQVIAVRMAGRFPDSGRLSTVLVRHLLDNHETDSEISAATFRLAVGPGQIRSTNWSRCVTTAAKGGSLVIEGKGYGHGVGMSQVSAYQLARTGSAASDILALFYPGAKLVQWW
jgi:peptidoglycan hydrolase-like amidase